MINWHSGAKQRCATQLEDLKEDDPEECLNIYSVSGSRKCK